MAETTFCATFATLPLAAESPLCVAVVATSRPRHWRQHRNFQLDLFGSAEAAPLPRTRPHLQRGNGISPTQRVPELAMRVQDYLEWRKANTPFESIAALTAAQWNLAGDGDPERLGGALVSANFFTFWAPRRSSAADSQPRKKRPTNKMSW